MRLKVSNTALYRLQQVLKHSLLNNYRAVEPIKETSTAVRISLDLIFISNANIQKQNLLSRGRSLISASASPFISSKLNQTEFSKTAWHGKDESLSGSAFKDLLWIFSGSVVQCWRTIRRTRRRSGRWSSGTRRALSPPNPVWRLTATWRRRGRRSKCRPIELSSIFNPNMFLRFSHIKTFSCVSANQWSCTLHAFHLLFKFPKHLLHVFPCSCVLNVRYKERSQLFYCSLSFSPLDVAKTSTLVLKYCMCKTVEAPFGGFDLRHTGLRN